MSRTGNRHHIRIKYRPREIGLIVTRIGAASIKRICKIHPGIFYKAYVRTKLECVIALDPGKVVRDIGRGIRSVECPGKAVRLKDISKTYRGVRRVSLITIGKTGKPVAEAVRKIALYQPSVGRRKAKRMAPGISRRCIRVIRPKSGNIL